MLKLVLCKCYNKNDDPSFTKSTKFEKEAVLKLSSMILLRVEVWRHHNSTGELPARQTLLRFLTINDWVELDENLKHTTQNYEMAG